MAPLPRNVKVWGSAAVLASIVLFDVFSNVHRRGPKIDVEGLYEVPIYASADRVTTQPDYYIANGERLEIIQAGIVSTHVRIAGGPMKGRDGWVPSNWIR